MGLDNPLHIAFLLVLLLLVFGAKRLPEMGRSLGEGLRGFKSSLNGESITGAVAAPMTTPTVASPVEMTPAVQVAAPASVLGPTSAAPVATHTAPVPTPAIHNPAPTAQSQDLG